MRGNKWYNRPTLGRKNLQTLLQFYIWYRYRLIMCYLVFSICIRECLSALDSRFVLGNTYALSILELSYMIFLSSTFVAYGWCLMPMLLNNLFSSVILRDRFSISWSGHMLSCLALKHCMQGLNLI